MLDFSAENLLFPRKCFSVQDYLLVVKDKSDTIKDHEIVNFSIVKKLMKANDHWLGSKREKVKRFGT